MPIEGVARIITKKRRRGRSLIGAKKAQRKNRNKWKLKPKRKVKKI